MKNPRRCEVRIDRGKEEIGMFDDQKHREIDKDKNENQRERERKKMLTTYQLFFYLNLEFNNKTSGSIKNTKKFCYQQKIGEKETRHVGT